MTNRKIRVAIFASHPIQYQTPLWRKLAVMPEFDVHVFFATDMSVRGYKDEEFGVEVRWDTPLLEGYASTCLSTDTSIQQLQFFKPNAKGLSKHLRAFNPDVGLMTAYGSAFHLGVFFALCYFKVPIVIRHEASDVAHARSGCKALVRDVLLGSLYARINRFAVIGTEAKKHLNRLGVDDSRMNPAPYCIDSEFTEMQVKKWQSQRERLRRDLGMKAGDLALVFSGKLIAKKDPLLISRALGLLAEGDADSQSAFERLHVIIAGDGELRDETERFFKGVIGERAHMLGFLNQGEMGKAYAAADALVLPSRRGSGETWGLVVNEGMQYGLPAIISDGVGSNPDLIDAGETGWVFKTGDVRRLSSILRQYVELSDEQRDSMRGYARMKSLACSMDVAAEGLREACLSAVEQHLGGMKDAHSLFR